MARRRLVHPSRQAELEHRAQELVRSAYRQMRGSVARRMGERGVGLTAAAGEVGAVWSQAEWTSILSDDVMPGMSGVVEDAWNAVEASLPKGATWGMKDVQQQYLNQLAENLIAMGGTVGARVEDYAAVLAQAYASAARDEAAGAAYKAALAGLDDSLDGGEAIFDNYAGTSVSQMVNGMGQEATSYLDNVNPTDYPDARAIWNAVGDERTREWHDEADGQEQPLGEPFIVDDEELYYPGDPNGSDENIINCVAEGTRVVLPGLRHSLRRWYEGELVRLRFASGNELTVTPNHPVLRADGQWCAAGSLEEGDQCVRGRLARVEPGQPDVDSPPAEVGQVHHAAALAGMTERVGGSPPDLHGDGRYGEVDVASTDRELGARRDAATDEEVQQFGLAAADLARSGLGAVHAGTLAIVANPTPFNLWSKIPTPSLVGSAGESPALVGGGALHPQAHGVAAAAQRDARPTQAGRYGLSVDAEALGDRLDGLTLYVATDDLVSVEVDPKWAGWVFNFDTGHGWYLTDSAIGGLVLRNCRCWLEYDGIDQAVAEGIQEES